MPANLLLTEDDRTGAYTAFRVWLDCGCPYEFRLPWPLAPVAGDEYGCPSHGHQPATLVRKL